jgi:hypothetical protein
MGKNLRPSEHVSVAEPVDSYRAVGVVSGRYSCSIKRIPLHGHITTLLDNNLYHLEALRLDIERAKRKDISDVRDFGDTWGGSLLSGIESRVDYFDLVSLIEDIREGLAQRRLALGS